MPETDYKKKQDNQNKSSDNLKLILIGVCLSEVFEYLYDCKMQLSKYADWNAMGMLPDGV